MHRTVEAARGKWRGILVALGIDAKFLVNKQGPCPVCGGKDRFRWDDKDGSGSYFCNQCRAGDGFRLLEKMHGWSFGEAARNVDAVMGNVESSPVGRNPGRQNYGNLHRKLWDSATDLSGDDPVCAYLRRRRVLPPILPACLRYVAQARATDGSHHPAMLAVVHSPEAIAVNIHRTFLGPNGKADILVPRALMPGTVPHGSAVRLSPVKDGVIGIAEGIETALAASALFGIPVWSALNAGNMATWSPPKGVQHVHIFGDADANCVGQKAAYSLANDLIRSGLTAKVHLPRVEGTDWADEIA